MELDGYRVRKWISYREDVLHESGLPNAVPLRKAVAGVVIANPFAGSYEPDLEALISPSAELGQALGTRLVALLGSEPDSYGKGGIAGVGGEQEHVVACVTTIFGDALREAVGGGAAWISSATKTASAGTALDVPLAHKDALYVRSYYDAVTVTVPDAPRPAELLIAVAGATGPRPHARVGGLKASEIVGDGLR